MHMNNMNSKINNKVDLKKVILKTVATAGVLAMAILAPNAIQILRPFIKNKRKYNSKYYLNKKAKENLKIVRKN